VIDWIAGCVVTLGAVHVGAETVNVCDALTADAGHELFVHTFTVQVPVALTESVSSKLAPVAPVC